MPLQPTQKDLRRRREQIAKRRSALEIELRRQLAEIRDKNKRLKQALKAVEFGFNHARCAACAGWDGASENNHVHTKDCIVAQALVD
jgi:hypothetical protein